MFFLDEQTVFDNHVNIFMFDNFIVKKLAVHLMKTNLIIDKGTSCLLFVEFVNDVGPHVVYVGARVMELCPSLVEGLDVLDVPSGLVVE